MSDSEEKNPWFTSVDAIYVEKIENSLTKDGIDVSSFRNELSLACGLIAGSYILRALTESKTEWKANDIDIWLPYTDNWLNTDFHEYLCVQGYNVDKGCWSKNIEYARFEREITGFYTYSKPDQIPIQILITRPDIEILSLIRNFDLTICRLYYTGYSVGGYDIDPSNIPKEVSFSLECDQSLKDYKRSLRRIIKYHYRGFSPVFPIPLRQKLMSLMQYKNWFILFWNSQVKNHDYLPLLIPLEQGEVMFLNGVVSHE